MITKKNGLQLMEGLEEDLRSKEWPKDQITVAVVSLEAIIEVVNEEEGS